jgi:hypothetical protein
MVKSGKRFRRLSDGYSFAGFCARATVRGVFGDPDLRIVRLERRSKKRFAAVAGWSGAGGTIGGYVGFATCRARDFGLFWNSKCDASRVAVVAP